MAAKPSRRPAPAATRISRLLKAVAALAVVKTAVLVALLAGFDPLALPQAGFQGVARVAGVSGQKADISGEAMAAAPALAQQPAQAQQAAQAQQPAPEQQATAQTPPSWDILMRKQEELNRREQSLNILEAEVNAKLEQLATLEKNLQQMLEEARAMRDDKFRHLVDVYANMKAKNAAETLDKLDEQTAVKILAGMRGRQAGEILNFVPAAKAARLSQALTRMQMPFGG